MADSFHLLARIAHQQAEHAADIDNALSDVEDHQSTVQFDSDGGG